MKSDDKISESEKKNLKKILGPKCREMITLCGDLVAVCDKDDIFEISELLCRKSYKETVKGIFTAKKNGKPFSVYLTDRNDKRYFILKSLSDYFSVSEKSEKRYLYFKNKIAENCESELEYENEKLRYINREFKNSVCWKFLGKRVTVSSTEPVSPYVYRNNSYELNVGISDKKIFAAPVKTYVMGVKKAVRKFSGKIIAVIFDEEDGFSFVATSLNKIYYEPDVVEAIGTTCGEVTCLYEKSCGAVVYKKTSDGIYYLLIKNRSRNVGFPKGHVELGENELETAEREIKEETNVSVVIDKNFRIAYNYTINFFIKKQAVYYVAEMVDDDISVPEEEILDYSFVPFSEALALLSYPNEKKILKSANQYIKNHIR